MGGREHGKADLKMKELAQSFHFKVTQQQHDKNLRDRGRGCPGSRELGRVTRSGLQSSSPIQSSVASQVGLFLLPVSSLPSLNWEDAVM